MNQLKSILLLGILTALLVGIGGALAPHSLPIFLGLALLMNLGTWFFSDKMVLAMSRAQPVPDGQLPQLRRIVEQIAANADIPVPRLYVMPGAQPNAFATGRNPEHGVVCVTEGILHLLDERELKGVLAHEMSHIKNRDVLVASIAAAIASAITYISHIGLFFGGGRDREGGGAGALLMAIVAPFGAMLVQLGISRQREFLADATGAKLCNDPLALASALQKLQTAAQRVPLAAAPATASLFIVNPFGSVKSFFANAFNTHPPLEERIRRLQQMASELRGVVPQS